jgi:hypothetical protein
MKRPYKTINKKGKKAAKQRFEPISVVVAMRLKER